MDLKALRAKLDELTARARAQLDKLKDDTPEEQVREIEAEHDRLMGEIEELQRAIADAEAAERAEQEGRDPPAPPADVEAARAAAVRDERHRITQIEAVGVQAKVERSMIDDAIKDGTSVHSFRKAVLEKLFADQQKQPRTDSNVHVGETDDEKRATAIENALLHRSDPANVKLGDAGREFRGMSLLELAREDLRRRGVKTAGMTRYELAGTALSTRGGMLSTSDFPNILANVANKSLRAAYEAAPQTFRPIVRETTVPDFKQVSRTQLSGAPALEKVNEHGEFKRGKMSDAAEKYAIATYGKVVAITRQVIINDDLDAFTRVPRAFGIAAANLESDLVWSQILANAKMGDNVVLFHATHGNLAAVGAAIAVASVSAGRTAMSKQKDLDNATLLSLFPAYLIVPSALRTVAEQFVGQALVPAKTADVVPESLQRLEVISEPRLEVGITLSGVNYPGSATAWYLAATPAQVDVIELAYLEGARGVYTETRVGFDVDGVEVKARLDVGAKAIDHRGLYKDAGA